MKPLHGAKKRLSRCPCCHSKYAKHKSGNHVGRQKAKIEIKIEVKGIKYVSR